MSLKLESVSLVQYQPGHLDLSVLPVDGRVKYKADIKKTLWVLGLTLPFCLEILLADDINSGKVMLLSAHYLCF